MSNVDELVRTSILAYPTLYSNRTDVLHHVLCVIGNGYTWVDGEPVMTSANPDEFTVWTREGHEARLAIRQADFSEFIVDLLREKNEEITDKCEAIVTDIDARVQLRVPINGVDVAAKRRFYPQYDSALLMTVPADVTAEWAAACEEMRVEAAEAGWVF